MLTRAAAALALVALASSLAHARIEPPVDEPMPAELQPAPPPAVVAPPAASLRAQAEPRFTLAPPRLVSPIAGHAERTAGIWLFGVSGAHLLGAVAFTIYAATAGCGQNYDDFCGPQLMGAIMAIGFGSVALLTLLPAIPLYTVGAVKGHRARQEIKLSFTGAGVRMTF
jgi:hypothetical protein